MICLSAGVTGSKYFNETKANRRTYAQRIDFLGGSHDAGSESPFAEFATFVVSTRFNGSLAN